MKALKITGIIIGILILLGIGIIGYGAYKLRNDSNPEINTRDLEAKIDKRFNKILKKNLRTGTSLV